MSAVTERRSLDPDEFMRLQRQHVRQHRPGRVRIDVLTCPVPDGSIRHFPDVGAPGGP